MHLSEIRIENFRLFGAGEHAFELSLAQGLTAIVGENDAGKTAFVDALRLALGTPDREFLRVTDADFHQPPGGAPASQIRVRCRFDGLDAGEIGEFAEWLSYEDADDDVRSTLFLNWTATRARQRAGQRPFVRVEARSGAEGDGPNYHPESRRLLSATYLRPLRDAERELSAGRGSRLAQILQYTDGVRDLEGRFDPSAPPKDLKTLSVLGIGDLANWLLGEHAGIEGAKERLNQQFLAGLSFVGDELAGEISVSQSGDPSTRLRQLLEKLELGLQDSSGREPRPGRGLGSNNLLFIACELLLLRSEPDGLPLLIVEEPEAHLHPQRQLRLVEFLQRVAEDDGTEMRRLQVILTTHSPNLASAIDPAKVVLFQGAEAYPMGPGETRLAPGDYRFLRRFLDVTRANLFFARGVLIVEGHAENLLLPTLATLIGRDLGAHGVTIVNVGSVGLRRYARVFQRSENAAGGTLDLPVACLADRDVMPDCAPAILDLLTEAGAKPARARWKTESDLPNAESRRAHVDRIAARANGEPVRTFVADKWTLEYDLAFYGLAAEVWLAARLALAEDRVLGDVRELARVIRASNKAFVALEQDSNSEEELASRVYAEFTSGASKAIGAQWLGEVLERCCKRGILTPSALRGTLPPYLVEAIDYVTRSGERSAPASSGDSAAGATNG